LRFRIWNWMTRKIWTGLKQREIYGLFFSWSSHLRRMKIGPRATGSPSWLSFGNRIQVTKAISAFSIPLLLELHTTKVGSWWLRSLWQLTRSRSPFSCWHFCGGSSSES